MGDARSFDHTTGAGHVDAHKGLYDDCINVKGNTLLLLISEIFGGVMAAASASSRVLLTWRAPPRTPCILIGLGVRCPSSFTMRVPSRGRRPLGMGGCCKSMRRACAPAPSA